MKKKPRSNTILIKLMIPIILLMVLQGFIFLGTIVYTGTLRDLKENAYKEVSGKVENRKSQLENMMVSSWSVYANYEGIVQSSGEDYALSKKRGNSQPPVVSDTTAEQTLRLLRLTEATGAFVIYNEPVGENRYPVFYVRDMEPGVSSSSNNDTLVEFGQGKTAKKMGLTLDSNWTPYLKLNPEEDSSHFFYTVMDIARENPDMEVKDLGRWSESFRIEPDGIDVITYTIPLRDESNHIYGVAGVEISLDYLNTLMPYEELLGDLQGGYLLGIGSEGNHSYHIVAQNNPFYESIISRGETISLEESYSGRRQGMYYLTKTDEMEGKDYVYGSSLRLYNTNTPYVGDEWTLLGIVRESSLLSTSIRLKRSLFWAFVWAVALGVLGCIVSGIYFCRPIQNLVMHLRKSNPKGSILLPRVYITEIDELASVVEKFSADVANSASRLSQILGVMDLPIGAIEYEKNSEQVFCTALIGYLLDFSKEHRERVVFSLEEYKNEMALFYEKTSVLAHNKSEKKTAGKMNETVYRLDMEGGGTKWLNFKVLEHDAKLLTVVQDVSEQMLEKMKIEYERDYDVLTNLLNRRSFHNRVNTLLQQGFRGLGAMAMWDLDNLKYINDTYGHDFGDAYIMEAAKALKDNSPSKSIVARMSGDEFLIFLYGGESKESLRKIIMDIHHNLHQAVLLLPNEHYVKIRGSGGIAWYPEDGKEYEELMKHADFAMYRAKSNRKGEVCEFEEKAFLRDELLFSGKEDLNLFIEENQVKFAFQPIVNARDGSIFAFEALMRPQGGNLKNIYDVMRLAKAQSKLYQIEVMSFMGAMAAYLEQKDLFNGAKIFINSIPDTCMTEEDSRRFERLYHYELPNMVIEMIESEKTDDECYRKKNAVAKRWKAEIALDDYGSGYNTEATLLQIKPKYVKIDMSIIQGIDQDRDKQALVRGILVYLKERGILSIAEGIETRGELQILLELGIDYLQGYYLGQPSLTIRGISDEIAKEIRELHKRIQL